MAIAKNWRVAAIILCSTVAVSAEEQTTVFQVSGMRFVSVEDAMTDAKSHVIFVDVGPVYFAIYGADQVAVFASADDLFDFDGEHLIRFGDGKPINLRTMDRRNALKPADRADATAIVKGLVSGERIRMRYTKFPSHEAVSLPPGKDTWKLPTLGFIYGIAVEQAGWADIGSRREFPPVTLHTYESEDGYASVSIKDLPSTLEGVTVTRSHHRAGTGVDIGLARDVIFRKGGKWWTRMPNIGGPFKGIVIRDRSGKEVFKAKFPADLGGEWSQAEAAARTAWRVAPYGVVEILDGTRVEQSAFLYGFNEMWQWGVQNGDLVPVDK